MLDTLQFPFAFWLSMALMIAVVTWSWLRREEGWGLPAIGVCSSVLMWYHGDALYNGYVSTYVPMFYDETLSSGWWQVCLFLVSFAVLVRMTSRRLNRKLCHAPSHVLELLSGRRSLESIQPMLLTVAKSVVLIWVGVFSFALWRSDWNVLGLVAPYLGNMAYPWARGQIASGAIDAVIAVLSNLDMLCAALFGVCAATLNSGKARTVMLVLILISWPTFLLDRTRNMMLVVTLPGLAAFIVLRLRGRHALQTVVLVAAVFGLDSWFKFVVSNRSETSIVEALLSKEERVEEDLDEVKHQGLNMYEELCWINYFNDKDLHTPDNGRSYLGQLAAPIPRALWPGKPVTGVEYARLRGQLGDEVVGLTATISTGMIGGGVTNFGTILGPIAAAFLMSLWCAFLARLDLTGHDFSRLLLYLVGGVAILNFGRDITFQGAYPTLFGFGLLWLWRKFAPVASPDDGLEPELSGGLARGMGVER